MSASSGFGCCDRKSRAAYAQSFAPWQQATIEITRRDHSIVACSRHIHIFLFFAHIPFVVNHTINATPPERLQQYYRLLLASLSPGAQQTTSWLYTERALSWHTRNRFMPTNLACPISRLRGEWDYTTIQRIHHRQTRSHGTDGGKDASEWR